MFTVIPRYREQTSEDKILGASAVSLILAIFWTVPGPIGLASRYHAARCYIAFYFYFSPTITDSVHVSNTAGCAPQCHVTITPQCHVTKLVQLNIVSSTCQALACSSIHFPHVEVLYSLIEFLERLCSQIDSVSYYSTTRAWVLSLEVYRHKWHVLFDLNDRITRSRLL